MTIPVSHAIVYDRPGYLARIDGSLTFLDSETDETMPFEAAMIPFCTEVRPVPDVFAPAIVARMRGTHEYLTCQLGS